MPAEDMIRELKSRGYAVEEALRVVNGASFVVVDPYQVEVGHHAGKGIAIAFATPGDYPLTPPGGVHVKPHLIPVGTRNVNPSPLGPDWQYWSRPIKDWRKDRSTSRLLSHLNRLMMDA